MSLIHSRGWSLRARTVICMYGIFQRYKCMFYSKMSFIQFGTSCQKIWDIEPNLGDKKEDPQFPILAFSPRIWPFFQDFIQEKDDLLVTEVYVLFTQQETNQRTWNILFKAVRGLAAFAVGGLCFVRQRGKLARTGCVLLQPQLIK